MTAATQGADWLGLRGALECGQSWSDPNRTVGGLLPGPPAALNGTAPWRARQRIATPKEIADAATFLRGAGVDQVIDTEILMGGGVCTILAGLSPGSRFEFK